MWIWRRLLTVCAAALMLCAYTVPVLADSAFSDVLPTDYFAQSVEWAVSKGITNGTSEHKFSPHAPCTKAQILTFLWRAHGSQESTLENPFRDISSGVYYQPALWSYTQGLSEAPLWNGEESCTRAAAVTYLWKLAGQPEAGINPFVDVPGGAEYDKAVSWALDRDITSGTSDTTFSPDTVCTRAQIVTFLNRYYQNRITDGEAYRIACEYWDYTPGDVAAMEDGTGYKLFLTDGDLQTSEEDGREYYYFRLRWLVPDPDFPHLSTVDMMRVDAYSGECLEGWIF